SQGRLVLAFESSSGLLLCAVFSISSAVYLPTLNLTAVLPSPNRSYAAPALGDTFFQQGTQSTSPYERAATNAPGSRRCAGTYAFSSSNRSPPLSVSRFSVH